MSPPAPTPKKGDFTPLNHLEDQLKRVLTDPQTPLWDFYTPLAAAQLWITVPEEAAKKLHAGHPPVCVFEGKNLAGEPARYLGVYSAKTRAEQALKLWQFPAPMTCVSAKGWQLLQYLMVQDADYLWLNFGLRECQYGLDADMIDILLKRPEPPDPEPQVRVTAPAGDPAKFLQPVKDLLARDATVRAAWILETKPENPQLRGQACYQMALLMQNPEDEHLLDQVELMVKALTPVQMEWEVALLRAEDHQLKHFAGKNTPFYAAKTFLAAVED